MNESLSLSRDVINLCVKHNLKLALTESSTGGYVAHLLTSHDGSSRAFAGSLVLYSALCKNVVLDISMDMIQAEGVVSEKMVTEMLRSMERFPADINVAISGVAGHSVEGKPHGTMIIGTDYNGKIEIRDYKFEGTRQEIKEQSAIECFKLILDRLAEIDNE